jgi:predicted extracellular nuclease
MTKHFQTGMSRAQLINSDIENRLIGKGGPATVAADSFSIDDNAGESLSALVDRAIPAPAHIDLVQPAPQLNGSGTISLATAGVAVTQNFDTLSNTAGSTTNVLGLAGWYFDESGNGARDNEQYAVDTGGSNTGDTFSYGAAAATDRALGQLRSGTLISTFGAQFTNNTGGAIGSLEISYNGEQWRYGGAHTTIAEKLNFQISFDATDVLTGTWIDIDALDFNPLVTTGTAGAVNGNVAGRVSLSNIYQLANALANGASFWIRWVDVDATGADDGLAIDDFSITAIAASTPTPGVLTIANVAVGEGDSGTTDMVFTVTRANGSTGAVDVTYTIADGSTDSGDFGSGFLATGTVSFADGETTAQIHVPIQGDTEFESNETFTIALSDPTGGATLGAQSTATGSITNDDAAPAGTLTIGNANVAEGDSGDTDMVFTVTRADGSAGAISATYTVNLGSGTGFANASDFGSTFVSSGTVEFADGATTAEVRIPIHGDATFEPNETFTVTLSAPTGGAALGTTTTGTGTITNDDAAPPPANVFINEIHYDNSSTDVGEAIEIAGVAGTDLAGYKLVLYNGTNTPGAAPVYNTLTLSGVIDDESNGYGALSFAYPVNGIQNGAQDGIALISPDGTVIQFLSYGGVITAAAGTPAAGMTSTDIGVSESPAPGVGFSLQLTGTGSTYGDFTWQNPADDSFGDLNSGQSFLPATGTSHIRIDDASVAEGNSGTTNMVFTVHRSGGQSAAASVAYTVTLDGTADSTDLGAAAVLSGTVSFGIGEFTKTIIVPIQGDTTGERNETFTVTLGGTTGDAVVDRGTATGTITNDDPLPLLIGEIQGEGHSSAYVGQTVIASGIVTAVDSNGFYMQDSGDGNTGTSDGIFVFTSTAPTVAVGDAVEATGAVAEFLGAAGSLTVTQINLSSVAIGTHLNALPTAILIGEGGVLPPANWIDDDGLTSYDPTVDGIDFWESMEGMRVTIDNPLVVSNTTSFGETDVVASLGAGATGVNDRGGITISPNGTGEPADYNPEKIQIDDDSGVFAGFNPAYSIGDHLSSVTGVLNYGFANYEVIVTEAVTLTTDVTLEREETDLQGDANHLSIATFNVENLDASDNKYDILAGNIVYSLRAPDIIALQEIQDADGAGGGSDLSGAATAQGLIDAIFAESGLQYGYIEIAPATAGSTGGEPGGNIRNGYLYNLDRVSYVAGSAELITGAAYNGSRNPLVATWGFQGQQIITINVHSTSRGGSEELWGGSQPPADAGDAARTAQAAGIKAYINDHLATDPNLNIAVLGDWNGFYFENAQTQLTDPLQGGVLTNLNTLLPEEERYSYVFNGNAQQIDNILVTGNLLSGAQYDAVHINAQFAAAGRATDHDPQVALLRFNGAPQATNLSAAQTYTEDMPIRLSPIAITDSDSATVTATLTLSNAAAGALQTGTSGGVTSSYDPATGVWTATGAVADVNALLAKLKFTPAANFNGDFSIATAISDGIAPAVTGTKVITGTTVNDAPSGADGAFGVTRGVSHIVTAAEFGFSDAIDGNSFDSVTISSLPTAGRLFLSGAKVNAGQVVSAADIVAGNLTYQAAAGATGATSGSFTFRVHDNGGTANGGVDTDPSANTITYTVVNRAPAGADMTVAVTAGAGHVLTLAEFGFSDPDGNAFASVTIDTLPASGRFLYSSGSGAGTPVTVDQVISAADIAAGKLVFKPAPGSGAVSFTFQVHDDGGTAFGGTDTDQSPNTLTFDPASADAAGVQNDMALVRFALDSDAVLPGHASDAVPFEGSVARAMLLRDTVSHAATVHFDGASSDFGILVDAMVMDGPQPGWAFTVDDDLVAFLPVLHAGPQRAHLVGADWAQDQVI